ncbi:DUF421 domain-containing protein [Virgibacillus sp. FSP13]
MEFAFLYIWNPIAVFLVGYILLRIMGKKAVSEMTSFDLLVVLILGTVISEPIVTKRLGIASYFAVAISIVYLIFSFLNLNNKFKKVLTSSPTVLVRNGDIDEQGLRKVRIPVEELLGQLRKKGYASASELALVVLEETGQLSAIPMSDKRPLQPSDLNMSPSPTFIPIPIIIDGELVEHNLKYIKKDKEWLENQLQSYNITLEQMQNVTLATLNQKGYLDVDTTNINHNEGSNNYKPGNDN